MERCIKSIILTYNMYILGKSTGYEMIIITMDKLLFFEKVFDKGFSLFMGVSSVCSIIVLQTEVRNEIFKVSRHEG